LKKNSTLLIFDASFNSFGSSVLKLKNSTTNTVFGSPSKEIKTSPREAEINKSQTLFPTIKKEDCLDYSISAH
jgi:hypothetical protein